MNVERVRFEKSLEVLERNPLVLYGSLATVVAGIALLLTAVTNVHALAMLAIMGSCLALIGVSGVHASRRTNARPRRRRRHVRADIEGVWQDATLVTPRAAIARGYFQPRSERGPKAAGPSRSSVVLFDEGNRILFEAEAEESVALEMLRALGLASETKHADFEAWPVGLATTAGVALRALESFPAFLVSALLFTWLGWWLAFLPAVAFVAVRMMMPAPRLRVGADGVLLPALWRPRFIPMSRIQGVKTEGARMLCLHLVDGRTERVRAGGRVHPADSDATEGAGRHHRDAAVARIRQALAVYRASSSAAEVTAMVARGERSREAWLEALHHVRVTDGGYREVSVRDEELWRIVEDAAAPEDARAGAAVVLRRSLDEAGKARIRVAADATASPRLRVALDAIALEEDGFDVLSSFEESAPKRRASA